MQKRAIDQSCSARRSTHGHRIAASGTEPLFACRQELWGAEKRWSLLRSRGEVMPKRSRAIARYRRYLSRDPGMLLAAICALIATLVIGGILYTYVEERAQLAGTQWHLIDTVGHHKKSY